MGESRCRWQDEPGDRGEMSAHPWEFDTSRSRIEFRVRHMMVSTVVGHFSRWRGSMNHDPTTPSSTHVEVFVDVASITTGDGARDEYLRTSDFLDVRHHPEMHFVSRSVTARSPGWVLEGDLRIRAKSRTIRLDVSGGIATGNGDRDRVAFDARGLIRRKDFGLTWSRFVEAGGLTVGDDVEIVLHVEATRPRHET